jgi:hypothetical protein
MRTSRLTPSNRDSFVEGCSDIDQRSNNTRQYRTRSIMSLGDRPTESWLPNAVIGSCDSGQRRRPWLCEPGPKHGIWLNEAERS